MSMYWTGALARQRNAPTGMCCTIVMTLFTRAEMRSGVCGQRGSGGNALSVCALAMPTRSAPSALARAFTASAVIGAPFWNGDGVRRPAPDQRGCRLAGSVRSAAVVVKVIEGPAMPVLYRVKYWLYC